MTEWGVVGVVIALIGLVTAIVTPIVKLTNSITKLTVIVNAMENNFDELTKDNRDAHKRIWEHNDQQDEAINNHERRIGILEHDKAV